MDLPQIPFNKELTYLGLTTYRDKNTLFGIKRKDRRQHVYLLGKSGTGKSVLMFNMIIQNIHNGEGVCMVDPHGENVEAILSAIPPHRMKDVIYFNPADPDYHIGFNVLELVDPQYKHLVASGLMGIFTKIWANAWSARMEYILNNAILALLDTPGTTLLGIPRMLVDKDYRQKIIANLKDPVIKAFWIHEYESWQDKFRNEAIAPIQNKVGQFLSTSIIRNVVGQSKSTVNIFDMMNEGKIFLVNVSKGRIGEDNSGLLGGMIITKIQLAAMERVRIPEENRRDFYLYVDEFQNFVTDAFAGILSEARKYRLNLTVAHQYTAQLISDKSSAVRDAVFGNVGTMIIFRVGADDAEFLEKEFEPEFTPQDIVNLPNYKVYLKLMVDGVTSRPFSAKTLPQMVKGGDKKVEEEVIKSSRELYCKPREVVEKEINDWSGMTLGDGNDVSYTGEKFPAICSACKKETTVPFKPDAGRSVYCKECMEKIKSGELKPAKDIMRGREGKRDDARFYKPLADLGIEFAQKDVEGKNETVKNKEGERDRREPREQPRAEKNNPFSVLKKIFRSEGKVENKSSLPRNSTPNKGENLALREVLNKTLNPISLDALKNKEVTFAPKDRSASKEEMNKLKDFITEKVPEVKPVIETPPTAREPEPLLVPPKIDTPAPTPPPLANNVKEVPEEVLRKILE
ncbi:type IV secretion system DNA-binding domain-containing protein [Candidatus Nomurabacteria bacterium]|nr:type IV secretion system DNA-binding domain-containing protein [Candidatus Nomurabacteria bacterium]